MNFEPVINARFKRFLESFDIKNISDGEAFEKFVNYNVLLAHQPDVFTSDFEMLDIVSVGGNDDMGIDGLAIKLNGLFVKSAEDVEDIVKRFKRANAEFIFIQSKYKPFFDKGEFNNFIDGVRDFLKEDNHCQPMNEKIEAMLKIKEYILSDDIIIMWNNNPAIRLYYVAMGKWYDSPHQLGLAKQFTDDINMMNTYEIQGIHFIDSDMLKKICDSNENTFTIPINIIDTMPLPSVENVDNSCIALCNGIEFNRLLSTEDGVIRKTLFNDNVRDYQGDTGINGEIESTIKDNPSKFILLNNGLTIVCDEFTPSNRKIILKNPQIVNGCQTSHVLFDSSKKECDLSNVTLTLKIISTNSMDITNQIVRGTNRQNIVYDEAFETTKKFHKDLEEFFNAFNIEGVKLYYERRARQYQHNPTIKQIQKINLRGLIQCFSGIFLNKPHVAHRHEAKLLTDFQNLVFQEHHSRFPYYVSALTLYRIEEYFRGNYQEKKEFYSYKHHIAMIFREFVAGRCPDINNSLNIDDYCNRIMEVLKSKADTSAILKKTLELFSECKGIWIMDMGKSQYGIKDNFEFTKLLLAKVGQKSSAKYTEVLEDEHYRYTGRVVKVIKDKFGKDCGFISRDPNNIFFHSGSNRGLNFSLLEGKTVTYRVQIYSKNNTLLAVDVEIKK